MCIRDSLKNLIETLIHQVLYKRDVYPVSFFEKKNIFNLTVMTLKGTILFDYIHEQDGGHSARASKSSSLIVVCFTTNIMMMSNLQNAVEILQLNIYKKGVLDEVFEIEFARFTENWDFSEHSADKFERDTHFKRIVNTILEKLPQVKAESVTTQRPLEEIYGCLLYTSPSPRDGLLSRMPSSA
eukprot:TRINITY_DN12087_c0_g1_i2.p1 TRINITY_DN12087_c0_g1~~TRINITY_DN12087_c0_g1_i2.p1  ORF type:complete len:184 (+),score=62.81 TRINITY_DN12087_c0_g1_i2:64-615(+)